MYSDFRYVQQPVGTPKINQLTKTKQKAKWRQMEAKLKCQFLRIFNCKY